MIIVIHNYFNLESKSQVIKRAKEEIMGAFDVVDHKIPNSDVPFYIEHQQKPEKEEHHPFNIRKRNMRI